MKEVCKSKPTSFFLSLIISDIFLHNNMIKLGANTIVIPKLAVDSLTPKYELLEKGIMQLYGKKVPTTSHIKELYIALYSYPSQKVTWEVTIIEIPMLFRMFLSRDFTRKIGRYLALNWSHLIPRTKHGVNIKNLLEKNHPKHITEDSVMIFEASHTSISKKEIYFMDIL